MPGSRPLYLSSLLGSASFVCVTSALLRAMRGCLHRHFNALQLVNAHQVSYKLFHNQLHWFAPFSPCGRRVGDEGAVIGVNRKQQREANASLSIC